MRYLNVVSLPNRWGIGFPPVRLHVAVNHQLGLVSYRSVRFHLVLNTHLYPIGLLPVDMSVEAAAPMAANVLFRRMELSSSRIASCQYSL